ncbi:hypothetical protein IAU60_006483 [Kwoniella sp. DSM 27419]
MFTQSAIVLSVLAAGASAQVASFASSAAAAIGSPSQSLPAAASSAITSAVPTGVMPGMGGSNPGQSVAGNALGLLSPSCQQTLVQLASPNSGLSSCLHFDALAQIVTTNGSIIPVVDDYLDVFCSSAPCSNTTIANATQSVLSGCGSDLSTFGITNQTLEFVMAQYPLARDVLCLKTSEPFNGTEKYETNSTMASNATSAGNSSQSTNGTFCATSLLAEFASYMGTNLTVSDVITDALGGNATALQTIKSIPPSVLCNDCIFAAFSLVEEQYPQLGNITIGNSTLNSFLEGTCNATSSANSTSSTNESYEISTNGTLPSSITESAVNSTLNGTMSGNTTALPMPQTNLSLPTQLLSTAASVASQTGSTAGTPAASALTASLISALPSGAQPSVAAAPSVNARAMKARWVGAQ